MEQIQNPIEGFFIKSKEDLIFDVKGIVHPKDRIIAFVRYVPDDKNSHTYRKIYALPERYRYLKENHPKYLYHDQRGRGLLQCVPKGDLLEVYNPITKLQQISEMNPLHLDLLEKQTIELVKILTDETKINPQTIGISGSILVNLQKDDSDIDLVVYGMENGSKIHQAMPDIFDKNSNITRYTDAELEKLWENRGQTEQIDLLSFIELEQKKQLQGKIDGRDFYIRLVLLENEYFEPYEQTFVKSLGEIELNATVSDASESIFTPCIYRLEDVDLLSATKLCEDLPDRIFSLRGRYCELACKGERIHVKGKLERVEIRRHKEYYQLTLGTIRNEFFKGI